MDLLGILLFNDPDALYTDQLWDEIVGFGGIDGREDLEATGSKNERQGFRVRQEGVIFCRVSDAMSFHPTHADCEVMPKTARRHFAALRCRVLRLRRVVIWQAMINFRFFSMFSTLSFP
jgi:hypothetical protein